MTDPVIVTFALFSLTNSQVFLKRLIVTEDSQDVLIGLSDKVSNHFWFSANVKYSQKVNYMAHLRLHNIFFFANIV